MDALESGRLFIGFFFLCLILLAIVDDFLSFNSFNSLNLPLVHGLLSVDHGCLILCSIGVLLFIMLTILCRLITLCLVIAS